MPKPSAKRRCRKCGQPGHYAPTCRWTGVRYGCVVVLGGAKALVTERGTSLTRALVRCDCGLEQSRVVARLQRQAPERCGKQCTLVLAGAKRSPVVVVTRGANNPTEGRTRQGAAAPRVAPRRAPKAKGVDHAALVPVHPGPTSNADVGEDAAGRDVDRCAPSSVSVEALMARMGHVSFADIRGERERELVRRYQGGDRNAGEVLLHAHRRLIWTHVNRWAGGLHDLTKEELYAEAQVGFLKAVKRYDEARATKLSTYAGWWIHSQVSQAKLKQGAAIRVPSHMHERSAAERGEDDALLRAKWDALSVGRLDAPIDDEGHTVADIVACTHDTPEDDAALSESAGIVADVVRAAGLTSREESVVRRRYLNDETETLKAISRTFGLSRERIRQIEVGALEKLRAAALRMGMTP